MDKIYVIVENVEIEFHDDPAPSFIPSLNSHYGFYINKDAAQEMADAKNDMFSPEDSVFQVVELIPNENLKN